jgi:hypothetical protein
VGIRLLGENPVLFRDESGHLGLLQSPISDRTAETLSPADRGSGARPSMSDSASAAPAGVGVVEGSGDRGVASE